LFNQPPSCGGIDADLGPTGAGNLELGQAGPESSASCAVSSGELVNLSARPKRLLIADERAA
jgi:hypothetical protein